MLKYCCISGVWEACFETAGDDIEESVTQELLGDYIVAVKLAKHWQFFWLAYGVAHRELIPETIHSTQQYENNRAEQSHKATRVRERGMRRFIKDSVMITK